MLGIFIWKSTLRGRYSVLEGSNSKSLSMHGAGPDFSPGGSTYADSFLGAVYILSTQGPSTADSFIDSQPSRVLKQLFGFLNT